MAKFLIQASYSPEGLAGAMSEGFQARMDSVTAMIEAGGSTIESIYFAYGDADIIAIVDGTEEAAIAFSMAVNAAGAVGLTTTPLIDIATMDAARGQLPDYRPPGE